MHPSSSSGRPGGGVLLLLPVFFLSGFAALVYQMIWQRVLTFFSGADVHSVTLIVAAFMAGLGFGSLAGGELADRLSTRRCFQAFALAEFGVAAFAVGSLPLYYDGLYLGLGERGLPEALVFLLLFLTLLVPTFLMGVSLPLLARTLGPTGKRPEDWIGQLYGMNTLGAALGSLLAVWWLVRSVGFAGSVRVAAALNAGCALVALLLSRRASGDAPPPRNEPVEPLAPAHTKVFGVRTWLLLFALSGFVALSLEILWFRILGVVLKSNAFTFATLLAFYLLGVGGGALVGSRMARRSERPTVVFLAAQALIPAYAALSLAALVHGVHSGWAPELLRAYLSRYETLDLAGVLAALGTGLHGGTLAAEPAELVRMFALLYGLVPVFLFGPATALMGFSFPFLQKATQTDPLVLGRRVGLLQAANILGCTLGAVVTGLLLLGTLGTPGTLLLLVGLGALFLLVLGLPRAGGRSVALLASPAVAAALLSSPGAADLWSALHGSQPENVLFGEDSSGLSVLKDRREDNRLMTLVFAGGIGQSRLPYGTEHTLFGALPALLHPHPRQIAIVGLGSGDTLFGAAAREETERLDCIEIVAPQRTTLERLALTHAYPGLRLLLVDPRVQHVVGDGRAFLMRGARRYDVIEADALRPTSAFAGSLYSVEYFELLRRRLAPGGYAVTWAPTERVQATLRRVFPYALQVRQVLIGSRDPIDFDLPELRARLASPFTSAHFGRAEVDSRALMEEFLLDARILRFGPRSPPPRGDLNRDLFPRDEYLVRRDTAAATLQE